IQCIARLADCHALTLGERTLGRFWSRCLQGPLQRGGVGGGFSLFRKAGVSGAVSASRATPLGVARGTRSGQSHRGGRGTRPGRTGGPTPVGLRQPRPCILDGTDRNGVREAPAQPPTHPPFCICEAWTSPHPTRTTLSEQDNVTKATSRKHLNRKCSRENRQAVIGGLSTGILATRARHLSRTQCRLLRRTCLTLHAA